MKALRNFTGLLIVLAIFLGLLVTGVLGNIRAGNYVVVPLLVLAVLLFAGAVWFQRYKVRVLLRDPKPDRLIEHYHRSLRRIPDAKAASAYLSALAAAFFGHFEKAREQMRSIPDPGRRAYVLSVLALLEDEDYPEAIRLADEGKEKEDSPVLDQVIRVVAGQDTPEALERLPRIAEKQHGLMPAMAAWAMAVYHKRARQDDKAVMYKAILKDAVPHALPLK